MAPGVGGGGDGVGAKCSVPERGSCLWKCGCGAEVRVAELLGCDRLVAVAGVGGLLVEARRSHEHGWSGSEQGNVPLQLGERRQEVGGVPLRVSFAS
jgi:hypothetical protein